MGSAFCTWQRTCLVLQNSDVSCTPSLKSNRKGYPSKYKYCLQQFLFPLSPQFFFLIQHELKEFTRGVRGQVRITIYSGQVEEEEVTDRSSRARRLIGQLVGWLDKEKMAAAQTIVQHTTNTTESLAKDKAKLYSDSPKGV